MLLATIAERARLTFSSFALKPMGSFSRVQRLQDGSVFPLHWDGSFMKRRSFNAALTHLLACVHEAGCFAQRQDPTVQLPYRINSRDGKIGDARSGDLSICYAK